MTTELKKKMEKLAEDFMEQWLSAPGSIDYLAGIRDYKAGFTAAVDEMEKINQGAREFIIHFSKGVATVELKTYSPFISHHESVHVREVINE